MFCAADGAFLTGTVYQLDLLKFFLKIPKAAQLVSAPIQK